MNTNLHDNLTIEADTVEEALGEVSSLLGADAEIVSAERVPRGGIGGFFAREVVQLTARRRDATTIDTDKPSILSRLMGDVDRQERDFGELLRHRIQDPGRPVEEPSHPREPTKFGSSSGMPAVVPDDLDDDSLSPQPELFIPATPPSPVMWTVPGLARAGAPSQILEAVADLDPRHDLAWVSTIAGVAASMCRLLPEDPQIMVGPRADRLGDALGLDVYRAGDTVPYQGSFCVRLASEPDEVSWLQSVMAGRLLHLVVDSGPSWHPMMVSQPSVVSWTATEGVGPALVLCATMGAVLGFGMDSAFGAPARRANPVDVALALRAQMERA